jgi:hypothetical protein
VPSISRTITRLIDCSLLKALLEYTFLRIPHYHMVTLEGKTVETEYRHTQFGALMLFVFLATGVLIVVVALEIISEKRWGSVVVMIFLYILGLALFYSFTVEISKEKLNFWFGIGVIRKSFFLSGIQSTRKVVNPWYYFWGVKSIPGGWLFAIAPGAAVEIVLKNGNIVQLGTNQPELLKLAIDNAIQLIG